MNKQNDESGCVLSRSVMITASIANTDKNNKKILSDYYPLPLELTVAENLYCCMQSSYTKYMLGITP